MDKGTSELTTAHDAALAATLLPPDGAPKKMKKKTPAAAETSGHRADRRGACGSASEMAAAATTTHGISNYYHSKIDELEARSSHRTTENRTMARRYTGDPYGPDSSLPPIGE